ncbi:class I SAM-dependent methyltransferase [Amycolatopsis minnesotensis]|uniref:class I SAM-dependent methyltransferase n=1 Tax=Amycolatopsis minnesotensis TaxID=337894 RepID=UPI0031D0AFF9
MRSAPGIHDLASRLKSGDPRTVARVAAWHAVLHGTSTVLIGLPLTGPGLEAAVATVLSGAKVVFDDPDGHPARALAALERGGAEVAVLDSARVAALAAEPAAAMTDLSELRQVLHLGGAAEFGEVPLVRLQQGADGVVASVRDHDAHETVLAAIDAVRTPGLAREHTAAFVARLDEAVLASMLHALQEHGVLTDPSIAHDVAEVLAAARVAPRHHAVVERWLTALTGRAVLARDGERVRGAAPVGVDSVDKAWAAARALWTEGLGDAAVIDYFRLNADHLPGLMSGEEQAALLLFPEGRQDLADALYRRTAVARQLNAMVAAAVGALADRGPLRVLEIGAGTGATSEVVFDRLAESGARDVDYHFTDVSSFFLTTAQERFPRHGFVRYGVFDADGGNREQGFTPGSVDVVIAAGALNNARDTDATLRRVRELLAPGGWLLLIEPTREYLEILISQAFMMTAAEDDRLRSGTTFLSRAQWLHALAGAGFGRTHVVPDDDHPLAPMSQCLLVARR